MWKVPIADSDDFVDWAYPMGNVVRALPNGWRLWARVKMHASPTLPSYLQRAEGDSFTTGRRWSDAWPHLVAAVRESVAAIVAKGWKPAHVDVFARYEPLKGKKAKK